MVSSGRGWCTLGPPVRDVQEDAAIAAITCHPVVMHDTYCGHWGTDKQTLERVQGEKENQELQSAYVILADEEKIRDAFKREQLAITDANEVGQKEFEKQVQQWVDSVNRAKETVKLLGTNLSMAESKQE